MNLYLDIETIPGGEKLLPDQVKIDARLKDPDKVKAAQEEAMEKEFRSRSLVAHKCEIACLAYAFDDDPVKVIQGTTLSILTHFEAVLIDVPQAMGIIWCGHNIRKFDLKIIRTASIKYGLRFLRSLIPTGRYDQRVFDTIEEFIKPDYPGPQNWVSMDEMCKYLGLPGKGQVDGSMVYDLFLNGEIDKICEYCKDDVEKQRAASKFIE